jgi:hypothetical protein
LYATKIASFTKNLPHNALGEPDLNAYQALIRALSSGSPTDFEAIPFGGTRKVLGALTTYTFVLEGPDSHNGPAAPPTFSSVREASEIAEDYWHAWTRDVAFADYAPRLDHQCRLGSPLLGLHWAEISRQRNRGHGIRGNTPGDPTDCISQFLWRTYLHPGKSRSNTRPVLGDDHMVTYAEWLNPERGFVPRRLIRCHAIRDSVASPNTRTGTSVRLP